MIQENADPEVKIDLMAFFDRLEPPSDHPSMAYLRHVYEGPDDMPAHIKAALLPVSLQIPMDREAPMLGAWHGIYLVEHRRASGLKDAHSLHDIAVAFPLYPKS